MRHDETQTGTVSLTTRNGKIVMLFGRSITELVMDPTIALEIAAVMKNKAKEIILATKHADQT